MIKLDLDREAVARIAARFEAMQKKVDHFARVEMGQVMSDWQTNDMHRRRPFTMRSRRRVQTVVRPHSLREVLGLRKYYQQLRRAQKITGVRLARRPRHRRVYRRWSTRPILRSVLESKLFVDMTDAFHKAITWSTK